MTRRPVRKSIAKYPRQIDEDELKLDLSFPPHWWEKDLWESLRQTSRMRHIIDIISVEPFWNKGVDIMKNKTKVKEELEYLRSLRVEADYKERMAEATVEADKDPVSFDRALYIGSGPNKLTDELFTALWRWPKPVILHFKDKYKRARPFQLDPWLRPGLDTPGHSSFPSGHSTQYHLAALVLEQVTSERSDLREALLWMAGRVAQNREVAGMHYPSDTDAGFQLAVKLVPFFVEEHIDLINKVRVEEWGLGKFKRDDKLLEERSKYGVVRDPASP